MKIQLERPCTFSGCRSWDSDRDDVTITLQDGWATVVDNIGAYAYSYPAELITGVVYTGAEAIRMAKKAAPKK